MVINNEDKAMGIDYSEVTITRRVYRDGTSEYLLNGKPVRLSDIQILLADAGVGQRSYSVIGQGMVDHVLTSSPEERKIFFDDATGVRGFQIKRHQSMLKLEKASENLAEVEMLLEEIRPRLRSLKRQISRLERREQIEKELADIQRSYFGASWWTLRSQMKEVKNELEEIKFQIEQKKSELEKGDTELLSMEQKEESGSNDDQLKAQAKYKLAQNKLSEARTQEFEAQRALELAKIRTQSNWTPLPLIQIIKELDEILTLPIDSADKILNLVKKLRGRLTRPSEELIVDPKMASALEQVKAKVTKSQEELSVAEKELDAANQQTTGSKTHIFEFQRELRKLQNEIHTRQNERNRIQIDVARIETKLENLDREMSEQAPNLKDEILKVAPAKMVNNPEALRESMLNLRHQLELIGGIDEETVSEYTQTLERHDFLDGQVTDIRSAIEKTEKIVDELDEQIQKQSETAFKKINEEFQKYFKVLFGGGSCSLIKVKASETDSANSEEEKITLDRAMEALAEEKIEENSETLESIMHRVKKRKDEVAGIEIHATPPGKRLKALNLLSGGERALTSIALLSAIMATNPSPFVILDEVDAALDEANTMRFANILDELRKLTQFIVITHNRATMERADLLYGVTMNDDQIFYPLTFRTLKKMEPPDAN